MLRRALKLMLASTLLVGSATVLLPSAAHAEATTEIQNRVVPVTTVIPAVGGCSNNNETINVSGDAHVIYRLVVDAAGGTHVESFSLNLQGVVGVGSSSGDVYRVVRSDVGAPFNSDAGGTQTVTAITRSRIVTAGPDNNSFFDGIYHFTVTPDGQMQFFYEFVNSGCTGG